jgi:hypothetical protein
MEGPTILEDSEAPEWLERGFNIDSASKLLRCGGLGRMTGSRSGARPCLRDLLKAEPHLLDTGHFALEDKIDKIAVLMRDFLARIAPK